MKSNFGHNGMRKTAKKAVLAKLVLFFSRDICLKLRLCSKRLSSVIASEKMIYGNKPTGCDAFCETEPGQ